MEVYNDYPFEQVSKVGESKDEIKRNKRHQKHPKSRFLHFRITSEEDQDPPNDL